MVRPSPPPPPPAPPNHLAQVVSDFLTAFDGEERYLKAMNKAYAQYTYRIAFAPVQPAVATTAAAAASSV